MRADLGPFWGEAADGVCNVDRMVRRPESETARRQRKRRKEKLEIVKQQVADGSLKIRKMTRAEREKYPPRPPKKKRA